MRRRRRIQVIFKERWRQKEARLRRASKLGQARGWRLMPVIGEGEGKRWRANWGHRVKFPFFALPSCRIALNCDGCRGCRGCSNRTCSCVCILFYVCSSLLIFIFILYPVICLFIPFILLSFFLYFCAVCCAACSESRRRSAAGAAGLAVLRPSEPDSQAKPAPSAGRTQVTNHTRTKTVSSWRDKRATSHDFSLSGKWCASLASY